MTFYNKKKNRANFSDSESLGTLREHLDQTDRRLVKLLSQDAQLGVNRLAEKMAISVPTVRTRLRNLLERNLLKIVGLLDLTERPELISAIVGINTQGRGRAREIARRIAELPFVNSACVVTGRFDIIVDVTIAGDVADLYRITSELIPGVGDVGEITRSETFVVMASCNKWVSLPEGCWSEGLETPAGKERA